MRAVIATIGFCLLLLAGAGDAQAPIYRCQGHEGTIYSDQPCADGAARHKMDDSRVTVYTPPPVSKNAATAPSAKSTKTKRAKPARQPDPAKRQAMCAKLEQSLRDVRSKMRSGYGVEEGERLKARRRQLADRLRTERCE